MHFTAFRGISLSLVVSKQSMDDTVAEIPLGEGERVGSSTPLARSSPSKKWMGVEVGPNGKKNSTGKMLFVLLLTSLFWGLSVFIPSLQAYLESPTALGRATIMFVFVAGYCTGAIPFVIYGRHQLKHITYSVHRFAFLAGLMQSIGHSGYTLLIRSGGESSLLAPLAGGLYLVVPVFMGLLFLREPITPQKVIGVLLAIGAILLLSITDTSSFSLTSGLTFVYFFMAFFGWGFDVFFMTLMGMTPHHSAVVLVHACGLVSGTIVLVPSYGDLSLYLTLGHYLNFAAGIFSVCGSMLYFALSGIQRDSSLVAPLSSLYIIWPVVWGLSFLHDVVTIGKILGIIVALFAILLMSIADMKAFIGAFKALMRRSTKVAPISLAPVIELPVAEEVAV